MTAAVKNISSTDTHTSAGSPIRVLLAAGGTGGHVYPAISIADSIRSREPSAAILFAGTRDRMEWETVPKAGYEISSIWISGFHRRLTPQNLLFPIKLIVSLFQSFGLLIKFKPDVVVACGGFASGPVGWAASKMGIPLILQEQNSYPGVTNRMLAKHSDIIFTAFKDAATYFNHQNVVLSGNPTRSEIKTVERADAAEYFDFDPATTTLLILGGSGGAKAINDALKKHIETLHHQLKLQIIWQCGPSYLDEITNQIEPSQYQNLRLKGYIDHMPAAYGTANLIITRAGAGTCSELMLVGKPAVLVPSPNVAGDHQKKNAKELEESGAAIMMEEPELDENLSKAIEDLLNNPEKMSSMGTEMTKLARPEAAKEIAGQILTIAEKNKHE